MFPPIRCALTLLFVTAIPILARDIHVASVAEFSAAVKEAKVGDVIVWKAGRHTDTVMQLRGRGEEKKPITVRAEAGTVFTGASQLELLGTWMVAEGLTFEGTTLDPIVLRDAQHCQVTGCTVRACNPPDKRIQWLRIAGHGSTANRVDHCVFEDKRTSGVMLVIDGDETTIATDTRIDHNLFRGISKVVRNGMEAMRIGDSSFQNQEARTLVEENRFEDCRGDAEVVSNKSTGNIYRRNVFTGCDGGAIVLRHGDRCLVEGNRIDGFGREKSGGIRVHGVGQRVKGNTIEHTGAYAIALPAGNSVPSGTGHAPVRDAIIENNTIKSPAGPVFVLGEAHDSKDQDTAPTGVVFRGNKVEGLGVQTQVKEFIKAEGGVRWE
jgi:poly(beta-D-mannuronate) lyase